MGNETPPNRLAPKGRKSGSYLKTVQMCCTKAEKKNMRIKEMATKISLLERFSPLSKMANPSA